MFTVMYQGRPKRVWASLVKVEQVSLKKKMVVHRHTTLRVSGVLKDFAKKGKS
jgi:hypothetical protein